MLTVGRYQSLLVQLQSCEETLYEIGAELAEYGLEDPWMLDPVEDIRWALSNLKAQLHEDAVERFTNFQLPRSVCIGDPELACEEVEDEANEEPVTSSTEGYET